MKIFIFSLMLIGLLVFVACSIPINGSYDIDYYRYEELGDVLIFPFLNS